MLWWRSLSRQNKAFAAFVLLDVLLLVAVVVQPQGQAVGLTVTPASVPTTLPTRPPALFTPRPTSRPTSRPTVGPTAKPTATPAPTPSPAPIEYAQLSSRDWAKVVKAPDSYVGEPYRVWGCITQFDAATGQDSFRAQASYRNQTSWFIDGVNALFSGDAGQLADYVSGDVLAMNVLGAGSFTYETQVGGNATAPLFHVVSIVQTQPGAC